VSFSGELAFELSVPGMLGLRSGVALSLGAFGVALVSMQCMCAWRRDTSSWVRTPEAPTTPYDVGLGWLVSKKKDFVGRRSHERTAVRAADRLQPVGLSERRRWTSCWKGQRCDGPEVQPGASTGTCPAVAGEALGRSLGLVLVRAGRTRHGGSSISLDHGAASVTLVDPVH
jgi:sarcosine oxidase subunit alpha